MIPITQQSCLTVSRSGPVIAGWCVWLESKERLWNSALPFAAKPTMLNAINPELISTTLNGKLVWIPNYTGYDWGGKKLRKGDFTEKNEKGPRIDFTSFRNICVYTHYSTGNNHEVNKLLSDHLWNSLRFITYLYCLMIVQYIWLWSLAAENIQTRANMKTEPWWYSHDQTLSNSKQQEANRTAARLLR